MSNIQKRTEKVVQALFETTKDLRNQHPKKIATIGERHWCIYGKLYA